MMKSVVYFDRKLSENPKVRGFYLRLVARLERWGTFLVARKQYEVHRCDISNYLLHMFQILHINSSTNEE